MALLIQGMRCRCKARNSQKKARKEWEKQKPPPEKLNRYRAEKCKKGRKKTTTPPQRCRSFSLLNAGR
jgi:hypothetical protein